MPPQPSHPAAQHQQQPEQTPPRATGSFNNDDSPSGIAVNTLLMAAYAMTEMGEKKDGSDNNHTDTHTTKAESAGEATSSPIKEEENAISQLEMPTDESMGLPAKATAAMTTTSIESTMNPASVKDEEISQDDKAAAIQESAASNNGTATQQTASNDDRKVDTSAPPIEERLSAEISPDNSNEKSRKRLHSAIEENGEEEEAPPSSFHPPPRPPNGKNDTKVELFRKPNKNGEQLPCPERNVSADSDDVTGDKREEGKEPPLKKAAVDPTQ